MIKYEISANMCDISEYVISANMGFNHICGLRTYVL